jgi:hypothetical protein
MGAVDARAFRAQSHAWLATRPLRSQIVAALTKIVGRQGRTPAAERAFDVAYLALRALTESADAKIAEQVKRMQGAAFGVEAKGHGREIHELGLALTVARTRYTMGEDGPARAVEGLRAYLASEYPSRLHRVEDEALRAAVDGWRQGGALSGAVHHVSAALGLGWTLQAISAAILRRGKRRSTSK